MTSFTNTYTSGSGLSSLSSLPLTIQTVDPTAQDTNYAVPTLWANTALAKLWILTGFNSSGGVITATWLLFSSELTSIETITGNDSIIVGPSASNNVNIVGDGSVITTSGDPTTNTETIAITGIVPVDHGGTGAATFSTNELIVGNGTGPLSSTLSPTVNSITIIDAPISPTDGTNKAYVDAIGGGFTFVNAVLAASTANLTATYNNGTAGVGATLTNSGTQAVFTTDGVTPSVNSRILVKDQTTQLQNGVYILTNVGSISTNWVLTRATDYDTVPPIAQGNLVPVQQGTAFARTLWIQTAPVTTIGTDPIVFQQFSPSAPLQLNVQTFTTSGTYTPTPGTTYAFSQVQASGGGAGGANALGVALNTSQGSGGGAGEYRIGLFTASQIGASQTITIGAAGNGGVGGANGTGAGASSFGSLISCNGGNGGFGSAGTSVGVGGGSGGSGGSGGYLAYPGGSGDYSFGISIGSHVSSQSGAGGYSFLGPGGGNNLITSPSQVAGTIGQGYGAGGGGAASCGGGSVTGGAGAGGIIIVTEYIT